MPPLPHISSLDVKSLLIRAPSTHRTSSPTSPSLGHTFGWKRELDGGNSMEGEPHFLSLTLSPVGRTPGTDVHWLVGYLQGAECCRRCSAQVTPLVPYQHIFDSVVLAPFCFSQLYLHHAPVSCFSHFSSSHFILSLPGRALWCNNCRKVCLRRPWLLSMIFLISTNSSWIPFSS